MIPTGKPRLVQIAMEHRTLSIQGHRTLGSFDRGSPSLLRLGTSFSLGRSHKIYYEDVCLSSLVVRYKGIGCLAEAPIRTIKAIAGLFYSCCLGFRVPTFLCDMDRSMIWSYNPNGSPAFQTGNVCCSCCYTLPPVALYQNWANGLATRKLPGS